MGKQISYWISEAEYERTEKAAKKANQTPSLWARDQHIKLIEQDPNAPSISEQKTALFKAFITQPANRIRFIKRAIDRGMDSYTRTDKQNVREELRAMNPQLSFSDTEIAQLLISFKEENEMVVSDGIWNANKHHLPMIRTYFEEINLVADVKDDPEYCHSRDFVSVAIGFNTIYGLNVPQVVIKRMLNQMIRESKIESPGSMIYDRRF